MRGRGHDEAQADLLPDSLQHDARAYRELVAAIELARDVGRVLRRPVALAVERRHRRRPGEASGLLGQCRGALDVRAPVRGDDLAVALLEARERLAVRIGRICGAVRLVGVSPPGEMRVDELGERGSARDVRPQRFPDCRVRFRRLRCGHRMTQFGQTDPPVDGPQFPFFKGYVPWRERTRVVFRPRGCAGRAGCGSARPGRSRSRRRARRGR